MNTEEYLKIQYPSGILKPEDIFAESLGDINRHKAMRIKDFVEKLNEL